MSSDSAGEIRCLPNSAIPDVVHFVFGLGSAPEEFIFCWYVAVLSAQLVNRPARIVFHYHHEPLPGEWWRRTRALPGLELRRHEAVPEAIGSKPLKKRAHRADLLRMRILLEEGGVYMDIDTITARPYAPLAVGHDFVIGLQAPEDPPRGRLCNAVMMCAPGSSFLARWLAAYEDAFEPDGWGEASVDLPYRLYEELGSECCFVAPTDVFLWPPWYRIRQIFQRETSEVPVELVTLHLWAKISGPFLETIEGFEWGERNPKTLYGRLLLQLRALSGGGGDAGAAGAVARRPLSFPAAD